MAGILAPHTRERTREAASSVPWHIWACAFALASGSIGGVWDISWHKSIGRDTFWTPAHMAIYLGGVVVGLTSAWLILSTTLGGDPEKRAAAVRMWGFRGPFGAFVCAWGAVAMIASAPFDNWWHNAYGLDVKILSPPHVLLLIGVMAVRGGAILLALAARARPGGPLEGKLHTIFVFMYMLLPAMTLGAFQEVTARPYLHSARFYFLVALTVPAWLAALPRISQHRHATTLLAGMYTAFYLGFIWILPLFPAEPRLGPVYQQVTHFVPPEFPLLLIVPAVLLDWLRPLTGRLPGWKQAVVCGTLFLTVFAALEWPFGTFLQSSAAQNRFFAANDLPFFIPPDSAYARHVFVQVEATSGQFWRGMAAALAVAIAMWRAGISLGDWLRRVRR